MSATPAPAAAPPPAVLPADDRALEAADGLRSAAASWIQSADAKATTIASVAAVMLGLVSLSLPTEHPAIWLRVGYVGFFISTVVTVLLCMSVIWPRTNRRGILGPSSAALSPSYFGDVPADFMAFKLRVVVSADIDRDRMEQAFVVAYIARLKMRRIRWTIVAFGFNVALLVGLASFAAATAGAAARSSNTTTEESR